MDLASARDIQTRDDLLKRRNKRKQSISRVRKFW